MRFTAIGLVCVGVFLSTLGTANAEATVNQILNIYDSAAPGSSERLLWETAMASTVVGFGWANTELVENKHEPPLYCEPPKNDFTSHQIMGMLRRAAKEDKRIGDQPYGLGILLMLQRTFPCNKSN
jgi:hypothetical protein